MKAKLFITVVLFFAAVTEIASASAPLVPGAIYGTKITKIGEKLYINQPWFCAGDGQLVPIAPDYKALATESEAIGPCRYLGYSKARVVRRSYQVGRGPSNLAALFSPEGEFWGLYQLGLWLTLAELECTE